MRLMMITTVALFVSSLSAQLFTYEQLAENPEAYSKKNVTFTFTYIGLKSNMPVYYSNRGYKKEKYSLLHTQKSFKLGAMVKKGTSSWNQFAEIPKRTKVLIYGKMQYTSSNWGEKFFFIAISKVKEYEEKEENEKEEKEENETKEGTRHSKTVSDDQLPTSSKITLEKIGQNYQSYLNQEVEFRMSYLGSTTPRGKDFQSYKKLKAVGRIGVYYSAKNKSITAILENLPKLTPIIVTGKIKSTKHRGRTIGYIHVKKVKATVEAVNHERKLRQRFPKKR